MKYMGQEFGEHDWGEAHWHWCMEADAVTEHIMSEAMFLSNAFYP